MDAFLCKVSLLFLVQLALPQALKAETKFIIFNPKYFELRIITDASGIAMRPCELFDTQKVIATMNGGFFAYADASFDHNRPWEKRKAVADGNLVINSRLLAISKNSLPTFGWSKSGATVLTQIGEETDQLPGWVDFALNAKPVLLQNGTLVEWDAATLNAVIADSPVPRSGLCVGSDGYFRLFRASKASIAEFAQQAIQIGCQDAINLDGGSSSSLDYFGQSFRHGLCLLERPVHNILAVFLK